MIPLFVECTGKQVVIFGGGEVAARKAGHFAQEAEVLMVSRTFSPSDQGAAGPDPDARHPDGDGCRARPDHRAGVPGHRGALRPGTERPDRGALQRAWRALQQRGRRARRRGHPGDDDGRALHDRDQHREREPGGLPVHPAGDREKLPVARCDDRAPAPLKGCAQGQKDKPGRAPQGPLGGAPRQDGLVASPESRPARAWERVRERYLHD